MVAVNLRGLLSWDICAGGRAPPPPPGDPSPRWADAANGDDLTSWLARRLSAKLGVWPAPNSVVVMDGCNSHRNAQFRAALRFLGVTVVVLPPYSPCLNLAELHFNTLKAYLRRHNTQHHNWRQVVRRVYAGLRHYRRINYLGALASAGYSAVCRP